MKNYIIFFSVFLLTAYQDTALSCIYDSDCPSFGQSSRYCCGGICTSLSCYNGYCYSNLDCSGPTIYCCTDYGYCVFDESDCPLATGAIVGIIFGVLIVIIGVATVISCCMCMSCPLHPSRRNRQGQIRNYNTRPTTYQAIGSTTFTSTSSYPQPSPNPQQFGGQQYQTAQNVYASAPPPPYTE